MATQKVELRPPLPPPLSHERIAFHLPAESASATDSHQTIVAIAAALQTLLPPGDCVTLPNGQLVFSSSSPSAYQHSEGRSLWHTAGLLEAIARSAL